MDKRALPEFSGGLFPLLQIILAPTINCYYNNSVKITFDPAKREKTLIERGLDFARAREVFAGVHLTMEDLRDGYAEQRYISIGRLDQRLVVWYGQRAAIVVALFQ